MQAVNQTDDRDIESYLARQERKELLRFLTCGSVDDGKSTLIGRLLYDSKLIYEDQLAAIRRDSAVHGTTGDDFDPALLTDGLKAEREQGITIDVAYRYFSTDRRKFIIADTPGHEQYTRNMATGASNCDLAVILVDARHGVSVQTRRHSFICSLLGLRHLVVAVNKMDLVDYSEEVFNRIRDEYTGFAARLEADDIHFIPLSALRGDNVVNRSEHMPWYDGSTLMHLLETIVIASDRNLIDFRFPVQLVNRPNLDFRGYAGTIASGIVRPGDRVTALPSRKSSRVRAIVTQDGELTEAFAPMAVTLTLDDEIDVSRGDLLVHPGNLPRVDDQLDAMVVWMSEDPLVPGKRYDIKHMTRTMACHVSRLRYQIDVNTLHRRDAPTLRLNEIGRCELRLAQTAAFDAYERNRVTGAFILIDRLTHATVAAGMVLARSVEGSDQPDHWDTAPASDRLRGEFSRVTTAERAARFGQKAVTLLLTGLTRAGKSTIAYALERRLFDLGHAVTVLDGQNLRLGVSRDLGFSDDDRSEALRRAAEVARMANDAGLLGICATVAPSEAVRGRMRDVVGAERFLVVHVKAPLEVCRARDTENLYLLAESGEIGNFPGVSSAYEPPASPDLVLETDTLSVDESVQRVVDLLTQRGVLA
ncbi:MAG: sulfate adenylyltransferase subunit CysN [Chromatiales bacterium]|nr:sulfate adenylyltransferase subunit CysN [Chromatiales bacterium]